MALKKVFKKEVDPFDGDVILLPILWSSQQGFIIGRFDDLLAKTNDIELFHEFYGYQPRCKIACDYNLEPVNWFHSIQKINRQTKAGRQLFEDDLEKVKSFAAEKLAFWLEHDKLPVLITADKLLEIVFLEALAGYKNDIGFACFGAIEYSELPTRKDLFAKSLFVGFDNITPQLLDAFKSDVKNIHHLSTRRIINHKINGDTFAAVIRRLVNCLPEYVFLSYGSNVLSLYEFEYFLRELEQSGRKIIGVCFHLADEHKASAKSNLQESEFLYLIAKYFGRTRGKR